MIWVAFDATDSYASYDTLGYPLGYPQGYDVLDDVWDDYDYCDEDCDWASELDWYDNQYKYYANRRTGQEEI